MRKVVVALVILLIVAHQDFWWWNDIEPLVFSFLPVGLAYHALLSVLAAIVWALAVKYCWPRELDVAEHEWADESMSKHQEL